MYLSISATYSLKLRKGESNDEFGIRGQSFTFNKRGDATSRELLIENRYDPPAATPPLDTGAGQTRS